MLVFFKQVSSKECSETQKNDSKKHAEKISLVFAAAAVAGLIDVQDLLKVIFTQVRIVFCP